MNKYVEDIIRYIHAGLLVISPRVSVSVVYRVVETAFNYEICVVLGAYNSHITVSKWELGWMLLEAYRIYLHNIQRTVLLQFIDLASPNMVEVKRLHVTYELR